MSQHIPDFSAPRPSAQEPVQSIRSARRPRRGATRQRASRGASPKPGGAVVSGVVVAALAVVGGAYLHFAGAEVEAPEFLAAPPASIELRQSCLDSSRSVDADGMLATQAADELVRQIEARGEATASPVGTEAIDALPALRLTTRVVRSDSYETDGQAGYVERIDVPATSGLSEDRPAVGATVESRAAWADAKAQVESERAVAADAYAGAIVTFKGLLEKRSDGSDVIGCVAAALSAGDDGTSPSILVVSDLKDRALANVDGSDRTFAGDWSGAVVHIVLACPDGRQRVCNRTDQQFTDRLAKLGVTDVTTYRPERLDEAVSAWLGHD
jgi:hypothetical protein